MKNELRICSACGVKYTHDPLCFDGLDLMAHVTACPSCSEEIERIESKTQKELAARERWESTVDPEYRKTSLDHPDFPRPIYHECLRWMRRELPADENKTFLGLTGLSGLCKTRVVAMIVKNLIWRGEHVTWVNSARFQWCCQTQFNDTHGREAQSLLGAFRQTRNLVFDDLGAIKSTEIVCENLYSLLEFRTANGLRMIWTSNESLSEILAGKSLTEKSRGRCISRLGGFSKIIEL